MTPASDPTGKALKEAVAGVEHMTVKLEQAVAEMGRGLGTPSIAIEGMRKALEVLVDLSYEQLKVLRALVGE